MASIAHLLLAHHRGLEPVPKHGSLSCHGCTALVARDVRYLGQQVICPRCGAALKAPGAPPSANLASMKAIIALAVTIAVVLLLAGRLQTPAFTRGLVRDRGRPLRCSAIRRSANQCSANHRLRVIDVVSVKT